jgi:hypothetical protein
MTHPNRRVKQRVKPKVRRPRAFQVRGLSASHIRHDGLVEVDRGWYFDSKDAKLFAAWLLKAAAWLEQERGNGK